MELQEIEIFIERDGRVRIEVRGMKGNGCTEVTAPLEKALGGQILQREMTPEAAESSIENVPDQQRRSGEL